MKVNNIKRKLIKPHTPTPQNLKNYKISLLDKLQFPTKLSVVLFYQSKPEDERQLEESLARTLVQFYPLAGRYIENDHLVDCSDEGAEFVEAEARDDVVLLEAIDAEKLNHLLPDQYFRVDEAPYDPLLSIQATYFPCGGLTIGISVSHRVFDISSLGTFIAAWSSTSSSSSNGDKMVELMITPSFDIPSLLPYKDHDYEGNNKSLFNTMVVNKIAVKRLLFNKVALTSLKSKLMQNNNGKTISGVRVVCAVIAKALIKLDRLRHGRNRDLIIIQPVNMRERTISPLSKHACGNFSFGSATQRVAASQVAEMGIEELVDLIGDAVRKSIADHAQIVSPNNRGCDIIKDRFQSSSKTFGIPDTNFIFFTDWSRFGFYEADFGFGKPVWTGIRPQRPHVNVTVLMSNKEGDGIEAWVHLSQNEMNFFEQDDQIKLFTV